MFQVGVAAAVESVGVGELAGHSGERDPILSSRAGGCGEPLALQTPIMMRFSALWALSASVSCSRVGRDRNLLAPIRLSVSRRDLDDAVDVVVEAEDDLPVVARAPARYR